jgi:hypothetical protein
MSTSNRFSELPDDFAVALSAYLAPVDVNLLIRINKRYSRLMPRFCLINTQLFSKYVSNLANKSHVSYIPESMSLCREAPFTLRMKGSQFNLDSLKMVANNFQNLQQLTYEYDTPSIASIRNNWGIFTTGPGNVTAVMMTGCFLNNLPFFPLQNPTVSMMLAFSISCGVRYLIAGGYLGPAIPASDFFPVSKKFLS